PLRPGLYRLDLVIKDVNSANVGTHSTGLAVPKYEADQPSASTLIVADKIEKLPAKLIGSGPFAIGASKVRPRMARTSSPEENLGVYMQIYNLGVDDKTHRHAAKVEYFIEKDSKEVRRITESSLDTGRFGNQITLEKLIPLSGLEPGKYKINVRIVD